MIDRIIEGCAKHKFLVLLFIAVGVIAGWHSMKNTKLDAIPDLSDTQVIVYAKWDRSPTSWKTRSAIRSLRRCSACPR